MHAPSATPALQRACAVGNVCPAACMRRSPKMVLAHSGGMRYDTCPKQALLDNVVAWLSGRASPSHGGGHRFKSCSDHHETPGRTGKTSGLFYAEIETCAIVRQAPLPTRTAPGARADDPESSTPRRIPVPRVRPLATRCAPAWLRARRPRPPAACALRGQPAAGATQAAGRPRAHWPRSPAMRAACRLRAHLPAAPADRTRNASRRPPARPQPAPAGGLCPPASRATRSKQAVCSRLPAADAAQMPLRDGICSVFAALGKACSTTAA